MKNRTLIKQLRQCADYYALVDDKFRAKAFERVAGSIEKLDYTIKKSNIGLKIPGVSTGILERINDYLTYGKIEMLMDPHVVRYLSAYAKLSLIIGIGARAKEFIRDDVYTISDLKNAVKRGDIALTNAQQLGLTHYRDLQKRIPREHTREIAKIIKKAVNKINSHANFTIAGSYRRGAETSGDIDILVTDVDLRELLNKLRCDKNNQAIVGVLGAGNERLSVLFRHRDVVRQVDILNVDASMYAPALLYFTGNKRFNETMRAHAAKRGFRLNQHGLFRVGQGKLTQVHVDSERDIFDKLEFKFVPVNERDS